MVLLRKTLIGVMMLMSMSAVAKVTEHVLLYRSVDQHGDSLTLSGKVTVPEQPKGVILLPHYTIASNDEVPSTCDKGEQEYYRDDYVLVMPDYIGYGASRDRVHPYLHGELTARNCVDMLLAVSSLQSAISIDTISIVGFSQGGATALWILKLIEEEYSDRIHVKACYAGSGPYDVAATYDVAVAENRVGMPMVIPMLVMGTSEAYDLHLKREDFLTPLMDSLYDDYIASKTHKFTELYFRMYSRKTTHWLSAKGADLNEPETRKMYEGLLRSSLVHYPMEAEWKEKSGKWKVESGERKIDEPICHEWRPKAPVYVMHSYRDDIVTFRCAENLKLCWGDLPNVTYDFGNYGSHLRSSKMFFQRSKKMLDKMNKNL